ncbi:carbohydrate ABC transporter permease [Halocynthiibacter sp. C4]|uniref:carbohydrate ABC transporter permease n=1 Tax=Halocynthiibacter sp. C4 TaxID=2992758 RepID=UPI00237A69D2|nr:carbohydrate ABC transporter permease [Halocynthiibacter sp. C4]MDE0589691.1 carbohydrate ABC transporter permease [Halocynthiibacter sp. C4]
MRKERPHKFYHDIVLIAVGVFVATPLLVTFLGGFKDQGELRANPLGLPSQPNFSNFGKILSEPDIWIYVGNSLLVAGLTVILTLIVASMAAYAFAQIRFFGSKMLMNYVLLGMMFPFATAILPLFVRLRDFGILNSYTGLILPQVAFGLGFSIILMHSFFKHLPPELWEAAQLDGCSYAGFFWKITLPLSTPIMATVGVFVLVQSWNNFLLPLVVLNDEALYTWPLGIMQFQGEYNTEWSLILAFVTLTLIPAILFFAFAQKYIVEGLTGGAVKG